MQDSANHSQNPALFLHLTVLIFSKNWVISHIPLTPKGKQRFGTIPCLDISWHTSYIVSIDNQRKPQQPNKPPIANKFIFTFLSFPPNQNGNLAWAWNNGARHRCNSLCDRRQSLRCCNCWHYSTGRGFWNEHPVVRQENTLRKKCPILSLCYWATPDCCRHRILSLLWWTTEHLKAGYNWCRHKGLSPDSCFHCRIDWHA